MANFFYEITKKNDNERKTKNALYYANNITYFRKYYDNNKDKIKEYQKEYRILNRISRNMKQKEYDRKYKQVKYFTDGFTKQNIDLCITFD
jgi:hypothetical protein